MFHFVENVLPRSSRISGVKDMERKQNEGTEKIIIKVCSNNNNIHGYCLVN